MALPIAITSASTTVGTYFGPWLYNGNYYFLEGSTGYLDVLKSPGLDPESIWTNVGTSPGSVYGVVGSVIQNGADIHVVFVSQINITTPPHRDIEYMKFDCSIDTWGSLETAAIPVPPNGGRATNASQARDMAISSTGRILIAYWPVEHKTMNKFYDHVGYAERSVGGVWTDTILGPDYVIDIVSSSANICADGTLDRFHVHESDSTINTNRCVGSTTTGTTTWGSGIHYTSTGSGGYPGTPAFIRYHTSADQILFLNRSGKVLIDLDGSGYLTNIGISEVAKANMAGAAESHTDAGTFFAITRDSATQLTRDKIGPPYTTYTDPEIISTDWTNWMYTTAWGADVKTHTSYSTGESVIPFIWKSGLAPNYVWYREISAFIAPPNATLAGTATFTIISPEQAFLGGTALITATGTVIAGEIQALPVATQSWPMGGANYPWRVRNRDVVFLLRTGTDEYKLYRSNSSNPLEDGFSAVATFAVGNACAWTRYDHRSDILHIAFQCGSTGGGRSVGEVLYAEYHCSKKVFRTSLTSLIVPTTPSSTMRLLSMVVTLYRGIVVIAYQGSKENVGGTDYDRIDFAYRNLNNVWTTGHTIRTGVAQNLTDPKIINFLNNTDALTDNFAVAFKDGGGFPGGYWATRVAYNSLTDTWTTFPGEASGCTPSGGAGATPQMFLYGSGSCNLENTKSATVSGQSYGGQNRYLNDNTLGLNYFTCFQSEFAPAANQSLQYSSTNGAHYMWFPKPCSRSNGDFAEDWSMLAYQTSGSDVLQIQSGNIPTDAKQPFGKPTGTITAFGVTMDLNYEKDGRFGYLLLYQIGTTTYYHEYWRQFSVEPVSAYSNYEAGESPSSLTAHAYLKPYNDTTTKYWQDFANSSISGSSASTRNFVFYSKFFDRFYIGGDGGKLMSSKDAGTNWWNHDQTGTAVVLNTMAEAEGSKGKFIVVAGSKDPAVAYIKVSRGSNGPWEDPTTFPYSSDEIYAIATNSAYDITPQFIAVLDSDRMAYSNDGLSWSGLTPPAFSNPVWRLANNEIDNFMCVSTTGECATSISGTGAWDVRATASFSGNTIYAIAYGNGLWIIVGGASTLAYSSDAGVSWNNSTSAATAFGGYQINGIYYNATEGYWYGVGGNALGGTATVCRSVNGSTSWAALPTVPFTYYDQWNYGIDGNDTQMVISGDSGRITRNEHNDTDWQTVTSYYKDADVQEVYWDGTRFLLIYIHPTTSETGIGVCDDYRDTFKVWEEKHDLSGYMSAKDQYCVTYNGTNQHVVGGELTIALSSDDGDSWAAIDYSTLYNPIFGTETVVTLAYGNSLYVAGCTGGLLVTSSNGTAWTSQTSPFSGTSTVNKIIWDGSGLFIAVGDAGEMATSTNGTTWTGRTSSFGTTPIRGVCYNGSNLYVCVGDAGKMASSANGTTSWSQVSTTTPFTGSSAIQFIEYGNSDYLAGDDGGILAWSTNSTSWTEETGHGMGANSINDATYDSTDDLWVIVGDGGKVQKLDVKPTIPEQLRANLTTSSSLSAAESRIVMYDHLNTGVGGRLKDHTSNSGHTYTKVTTANSKEPIVSYYTLQAEDDQ